MGRMSGLRCPPGGGLPAGEVDEEGEEEGLPGSAAPSLEGKGVDDGAEDVEKLTENDGAGCACLLCLRPGF